MIIKKTVQYASFFMLLLLFVILDCCFFEEFFVLSFLKLSLVMCCCVSFLLCEKIAFIFCITAGLLTDCFTLSFPYFSLLYLYISSGCVWCKRAFLNIKGTRAFYLCLLLFFLLFQIIKASKSLFIGGFLDWESLPLGALFSIINTIPFFLIYKILKRYSL